MAGRAPRALKRDRPDRLRADERFAVVAARFNEEITKRLVEGAMRVLTAAGVPDASVEVHWVPGSFELPQAAAHLARTGRYHGMSDWELVEETHTFAEWKKNFREGTSTPIPWKDVLEAQGKAGMAAAVQQDEQAHRVLDQLFGS